MCLGLMKAEHRTHSLKSPLAAKPRKGRHMLCHYNCRAIREAAPASVKSAAKQGD